MTDRLDDAGARAEVSAYYRDANVRARLLEYCGAGDGNPTAVFVAGFDPDQNEFPTWHDAEVLPIDSLDDLLARGRDVARSLWDTRSLIFLIDLDYQNLDCPAEPFTHPAEMLFKLERAYATTLSVLAASGIHPLVTGSGRGYHFVGRVPLDSPVVDTLAAIGHVPLWHARHATAASRMGQPAMAARQAAAADGLGLVIEFLVQSILHRSERRSIVPVVLNGTTVGSGLIGRECVSIDFSHVGDPLDMRHVRMGFSAYQWHRARPDIFGGGVAALPPLACAPRTARPLEGFIRAGRTLEDAARIAARESGELPDISSGVARALDAYRESALALFHEDFRAALQDDAVDHDFEIPADLPPCILRPLLQPNDLLLKPEYLQNLVRGLLSRGWTAAAIARLVAREYSRDHQWGDRWNSIDAQSRARFDVRVFAGLLMTGVDRLVDFNCTSSQEKDTCPRSGCRHDLREDRARLRARLVS